MEGESKEVYKKKVKIVSVFLKNSSLNLVSQVINIVLVFATRMILLEYLGIEILGISSTLTSLISALSLADLGFQAAITYRLYLPLQQHDESAVNEIINIFRFVYQIVGVVVLVLGLLATPFLGYVLKGVEITWYVYAIYYLLLGNTVCSYWLSYKQTLLYADQKEYITKSVQILFCILCGFIKLLLIIYYGNYLVYLVVEIIQTCATNILIQLICSKKYPFLHRARYSVEKVITIMGDAKNVFASKMATYVYSSTDNVVISVIIGSIAVGYLTNYTMVISQIKNIINAVMNPITPLVGRLLVSREYDSKLTFRMLASLRGLVSLLLCVPTYCLMELFIELTFGKQYIVEHNMLFLLIIELYINIVYATCYEFNNAAGLFVDEKKVMLFAALMNISISIILAKNIGIVGVIIGTVCSQFFLWVTRSYIAIRKCLKGNWRDYLKYWIRNLYDIFVFFVALSVGKGLYTCISIQNSLIQFIVCGFVILASSLFIYFTFHFFTGEVRIIKQFIKVVLGGK